MDRYHKCSVGFIRLKIRKDIHLVEVGNWLVKSLVSYTLTKSEWIEFCKFLKVVKFFEGFISNILQCMNANEEKISGLKTHDYHVLLYQLLPIGVLVFFTQKCVYYNYYFSWFVLQNDKNKWFEQILVKSYNYIVQIEKNIFAFFFQCHGTRCNSLAIWDEGYWSCFLQLDVFHWKKSSHTKIVYVHNKARPKGSITEGYLMNKSSTFCSRYLSRHETQFTRDDRNDYSIEVDEVIGEYKVFVQKVQP